MASNQSRSVARVGEKPIAAFVLSIISGVFVLAGGLAYAGLSPILAMYGIPEPLAFIGVAWAAIILSGGTLFYLKPDQHGKAGGLVLAGSILSLWGAFGGIFVGLLLGVIAGGLGILWKPTRASTISREESTSEDATIAN